jgi:hypothetical protein
VSSSGSVYNKYGTYCLPFTLVPTRGRFSTSKDLHASSTFREREDIQRTFFFSQSDNFGGVWCFASCWKWYVYNNNLSFNSYNHMIQLKKKYIKFTRLGLLLYSVLLCNLNYIQNKHSAYIERFYSNFMCTESQLMSDVQIPIGYLCVT